MSVPSLLLVLIRVKCVTDILSTRVTSVGGGAKGYKNSLQGVDGVISSEIVTLGLSGRSRYHFRLTPEGHLLPVFIQSFMGSESSILIKVYRSQEYIPIPPRVCKINLE